MEKSETKQTTDRFRQECLKLIPKNDLVEFDIDRYLQTLETPEIDDAQKSDFLNSMLAVIVSLIDLGYGIHPAQQVKPTIH